MECNGYAEVIFAIGWRYRFWVIRPTTKPKMKVPIRMAATYPISA